MDKEIFLENYIVKARECYYAGNAIMTDAEYDEMENALKAINPNNSILNKVGHNAISNKVKHINLMYSLEKTKDIDSIMKKFKNNDLVLMPKGDGAGIELVYFKGNLISASTRGDKEYGENIPIEKIKLIDGIPLTILDNTYKNIQVYGEVYISKETFKQFKDEFKDARNLAAGSLLCDDLEIIKNRNLKFLAYRMEGYTNKHDNNLFVNDINALYHNDFNIIPFYKFNQKFITREFLDNFEFNCDGFVIRINDNNKCKELGYTGHHPRFSIAYKFEDESARTKIKNIELSISRTGVLTPIAIIDEVNLAGASINKVSLSNISNMFRLKAIPGNTATVVRANQVIPCIIKCDDIKINLDELLNKYINKCLYCNSNIAIEESKDGIMIAICSNDNCYKKNSAILNYFTNCLDIKEFGEVLCDNIARTASIIIKKNILQLFTETPDKLLNIIYNATNKSKVTTNKIIDNINKAKKSIRFVDFFTGLGIDSLGRETLNKLHKEFSINDLLNIDKIEYNKLRKIIGDVTINNAKQWFKNNKWLVEELLKVFNVIDIVEKFDGKLNNKSFCITGTLTNSRSYYENLIIKNGGIINKSVTKNTNYLLAGSDCGSKLDNAKKLNVTVINENDLLKMI